MQEGLFAKAEAGCGPKTARACGETSCLARKQAPLEEASNEALHLEVVRRGSEAQGPGTVRMLVG